MTIQQWIIFGTLLLTLVLFITGRWRFDVVALLALMIVAVTGVVPAERAFSGFSNPAVVTVAAVLVISRSLQNSGVVDLLGRQLLRLRGGITIQLAATAGIVALLSAFMNNIGALALMMPVALQVAHKKGFRLGHPHAPGLRVAPGRHDHPDRHAAQHHHRILPRGAGPSISHVRLRTGRRGVAVVGLLFIVLLGWRLIPRRRGQAATDDLFEVEKYITEVRLRQDSRLVGKRLPEINALVDGGVNVLGLVRNGEAAWRPAEHRLRRGRHPDPADRRRKAGPGRQGSPGPGGQRTDHQRRPPIG